MKLRLEAPRERSGTELSNPVNDVTLGTCRPTSGDRR